MKKHAFAIMAAVILSLSTAVIAFGQTQTQPQTPTTKTVVQNPDGTYTVIEIPAGKELQVKLDPTAPTAGTGMATVLRDDKGTSIKLHLTGLPATTTTMTLYAIDETGAITSLGPIAIAKGEGLLTTTTPLTKFMLIASPEGSLTAYDATTPVFFRSAVPAGLAVVPRTTAPVGEKVSASTTEVSPTDTYKVPMLNIPAFKKGDDTKIKINFTGALTGSRANISITPRKDGPTEVKLRFHELKDAPAGKVFVLWGVGPDGKFQKLGQIVNTGGRNEAEIKGETAMPDFGLLVTLEDATKVGEMPAGARIGDFIITP
jgi:hypothetical protein